MSDTITVVTCTVGDSAGRLEILLSELRRFTRLDYRHVVCDDGTLDGGLVRRQREICARHPDTLWTQNPGPVWGISYNFNHALSQVKTPWAFLVEDGVRPPQAWLEIALNFIERIGCRSWGQHRRRVGMAGCTLLEDWTLAAGGAIPCELGPMDFYRQAPLAYDRFYGPWNDGWWCWPRLLPGFLAAFRGDTSGWTDDMAMFRDTMLPGMQNWDARLSETEQQQRWQKWHGQNRWPNYRCAGVGWYPGPVLILNMDAWRSVGRMRDGCTFFEGHLGTRMGMNGYLSLVVETPPYLHQRSQGFRMCHLAASPRDHRGTDDIFREDFGHDHMAAPNVLATGVVSIDEQREINAELSMVELDLPGGWERWV